MLAWCLSRPGGRSPWRQHPKSTIHDVRGGREVYEWLETLVAQKGTEDGKESSGKRPQSCDRWLFAWNFVSVLNLVWKKSQIGCHLHLKEGHNFTRFALQSPPPPRNKFFCSSCTWRHLRMDAGLAYSLGASEKSGKIMTLQKQLLEASVVSQLSIHVVVTLSLESWKVSIPGVFFLELLNLVQFIPLTTKVITFLIGNPFKPSFTTVTVRGPHPKYEGVFMCVSYVPIS